MPSEKWTVFEPGKQLRGAGWSLAWRAKTSHQSQAEGEQNNQRHNAKAKDGLVDARETAGRGREECQTFGLTKEQRNP